MILIMTENLLIRKINRMLKKTKLYNKFIIIIWDDKGGMFGGFFTHGLEQTNDFYGTG